MKKSMIAVFAGLMSVAAFAEVNDIVFLSFSTSSNECYADGSQVIPGEVYALVWTPAGSEFAGINADGTAIAPSKVALLAPIANKECQNVNFQADTTWVNGITDGREGTWSVYLLDTRRYPTVKDAEGNDVVDKSGTPTVGGNAVNGYGAVATLAGEGMSISGAASGAVAVTTGSAAPAAASNLKVRDIKFIGDNVYIYVTGSLSCLQYELKSGNEPGALAAPADGKAQYGTGDDNMVIITPKKPGAQFFKVNRK